jgi:hypothetical protein
VVSLCALGGEEIRDRPRVVHLLSHQYVKMSR